MKKEKVESRFKELFEMEGDYSGQCYFVAAMAIGTLERRFPERKFSIVHGTVAGGTPSLSMVHAWVECEDYCYDLNIDKGMYEQIELDFYYAAADVINRQAYTRKEAQKKMNRFGHYGTVEKGIY